MNERIPQGPQPWTLTARWVFSVDRPPIEHGMVTVAGERIVEVSAGRRTRPGVDLGAAAVLPGLVNAHTHLDLTGLRGCAAPGERFTQWLREVVEFRRRRSPEDVARDVRAGLAESLANGTTLLGDISAAGSSWQTLAAAPVRGVVFYELIGLPRERARLACGAARAWLDGLAPCETLRPGLSPHAPYSVRRSLFRAAAAEARRRGLPLATHLAESREELRLLQERAGPFVDFLSTLDVYDANGLVHDLYDVICANEGVAPLLLVHGNYLDQASHLPQGSTIVYCPRTHAAFGHEPHPFSDFLASGVRVALGTDSLASNPDLSVLEEARFLHRAYPQLPGAVVLRMATLWGAEALGWGEETGSLTPGKSADLVVVPLPAAEEQEGHSLLLDSCAAPSGLLFRGRWLKTPA